MKIFVHLAKITNVSLFPFYDSSVRNKDMCLKNFAIYFQMKINGVALAGIWRH